MNFFNNFQRLSNLRLLEVACYCSTYRCGGILRGSRTAYNHQKLDLSKNPPIKGIGDFDRISDSFIYENHWSITEKVSTTSSKTVLELVFEIARDFVFTPSASQKGVTSRLKTFRSTFDNISSRLPTDFDGMLKFLEPFLLPITKFHVCPNDCVIFRKKYAYEKVCPKCGSERYKKDGKTALRNFSYIPLVPRFRRLFRSKKTADLIKDHLKKTPCIDKLCDIHDSPMWKSWFSDDGEFKGNENSIALSLCLDGVNPFSALKTDYSFMPIEMCIENFPPMLRKTGAGIFVSGIIPGNGTGEAKSLQPYMEILVDELMALQECNMKDYRGNDLTVSVKCLRYILDFPAIGKVLNLPGSARSFRACPFCTIIGESCACNKTLFLQNRRYLPIDHPLRKQAVGHVKGEVENRPPPSPPPNMHVTRTLREDYDKLPNKNRKKKYILEHGVKGCYELMRLD